MQQQPLPRDIPAPLPEVPLLYNTIGAVYCTFCSCCVESIFRDEQIAGPEFQHQKRSVFRTDFSSSTDGPRTAARKLVSFARCYLQIHITTAGKITILQIHYFLVSFNRMSCGYVIVAVVGSVWAGRQVFNSRQGQDFLFCSSPNVQRLQCPLSLQSSWNPRLIFRD